MARSRGTTRGVAQSEEVVWAGSGGFGGGDDAGGDSGDDAEGDLVIKVPTALQGLLVSAPIALTFQ